MQSEKLREGKMIKKLLMFIMCFTLLFSATSCISRGGEDSSPEHSGDTGASEDDSEEVLPVKEIVYTDMLSSKNINFFGF